MTSLTLLLLLAGAQEWSRFRGPNGAGVSDATTIPAEWKEGDFNWRLRLPGGGHSSPVLWGARLFLTSADAEKAERYLLCIDAEKGAILWTKAFPFERYKLHKNASYAANTPAADADRVYALWQTRKRSTLHAFRHDGTPAWTADLGPYRSGHGTGSSPIVAGDLVVVCNDQDGESFLLAVDAATGRERWRVPRVGDRACYSTPCVYERPGGATEIIFTHSYRGITGVEARTGRKAWEIDVFGRHQQRAIGSPVIFGDLVIGSSGFTTKEKNVVAVRPGDGGVKEVYRLQDRVPHVPTPLVLGDRLFLWGDTGIVTCADAATGRVVWQERVPGAYYGSPVAAGGRLYCADEKGVVTVIAAGDAFGLLARNDLGGETRSTPAIAGGVMYVRTRSVLVSVGGAD